MVFDGRPRHDTDRPGAAVGATAAAVAAAAAAAAAVVAVVVAVAAVLPLLPHPVVHPRAVAAEAVDAPPQVNQDGLRREMDLLAQDARERRPDVRLAGSCIPIPSRPCIKTAGYP